MVIVRTGLANMKYLCAFETDDKDEIGYTWAESSISVISVEYSVNKSVPQKLQRKPEWLEAILDLNQFYQWLQLALEKAQENSSSTHCEKIPRS